jgi:hypothetical protein
VSYTPRYKGCHAKINLMVKMACTRVGRHFHLLDKSIRKATPDNRADFEVPRCIQKRCMPHICSGGVCIPTSDPHRKDIGLKAVNHLQSAGFNTCARLPAKQLPSPTPTDWSDQPTPTHCLHPRSCAPWWWPMSPASSGCTDGFTPSIGS